MSKLQKALQQLRASGKREAGQSDEFTSALGTTGQIASGFNRQSMPRRVMSESASVRYDVDGEHLPSFSVEIDTQRLVDGGLRPPGEDYETIEQQFRRIKRPILRYALDRSSDSVSNANAIMVASALPKSGKTFCSFNLAVSIAREMDTGAVLVDADVLKPNISRALNLESRPGLIDYLIEPSIELEDILVGTDLHDIVVIPAGRLHDEATELLASKRMGRFIDNLSAIFPSRAIIFDTPPLLITNEAHVLAEHMGQIIFVIEAGATTHDAVHQALASLNRNKPINAILNKAREHSFGEYGGSTYGYYPVRGREHSYARENSDQS